MFFNTAPSFESLRKKLKKERRVAKRRELLTRYLLALNERYWESAQSILFCIVHDIRDTFTKEQIDELFMRTVDQLLDALRRSRPRRAERLAARTIAFASALTISPELLDESVMLCIECACMPPSLGLKIASQVTTRQTLSIEELEAFRLKFLRSGDKDSFAEARQLRNRIAQREKDRQRAA